MARRAFAALALLASLLVTACQHPVELVSAHLEVLEIILADSSGAEIARTVENLAWDGERLPLSGSVGQPLRLEVRFLDLSGEVFDIAHRGDMSIRVEAEDGVSADWEHLGAWGYLHLHRAGSFRVRFLVWHLTHPDFISPWVTVEVAP